MQARLNLYIFSEIYASETQNPQVDGSLLIPKTKKIEVLQV